MKRNLAHKIRIYPNQKQEILLKKSCGVARFADNWGLSQWKEQYELGENPNSYTLKKEFNAIKKEQYSFVLEVTKCASEKAIMNVGAAFKNFFKGKSKYPHFKKKFRHNSFYISNDQFKVEDKKVRLPKIGHVRMAEPLRFSGKIMSGTVSRRAGPWFISVFSKKDQR